MTTPFPFQGGATLLASQLNAITELVVNDKTASHTLTAADAGGRVIMNSASATTITVDTSVFTAGQVIYVTNKGVGVCTITAGSATVSTTGTLALSQFASGVLYCISAGVFLFEAYGVAAAAPGLELISTTTIGTTVATVNVTGAFSATYDAYKIIVTGGVGSTDANLSMTLGAAVANYNSASVLIFYNANTVSGSNSATTTSFRLVGTFTTTSINANIDVFAPFLTKNTHVQAKQTNATAGTGSVQNMGGVLMDTTSHTSFELSTSTGTITGGTIRVYGYKN